MTSLARPSVVVFTLAMLLQIQPVSASAGELFVAQDHQGTYSRSAFNHWIDEKVSEDPLFDQLTKLSELFKKGLIDEAEYKASKAKSLGLK